MQIESAAAFSPAIGEKVWAKDSGGRWYAASVLSIGTRGEFQVAFDGFSKRWDESIRDSANFREVVRMGNRIAKEVTIVSEHGWVLGVFMGSVLFVESRHRRLDFIPVSSVPSSVWE
jgi:hypothetical protein